MSESGLPARTGSLTGRASGPARLRPRAAGRSTSTAWGPPSGCRAARGCPGRPPAPPTRRSRPGAGRRPPRHGPRREQSRSPSTRWKATTSAWSRLQYRSAMRGCTVAGGQRCVTRWLTSTSPNRARPERLAGAAQLLPGERRARGESAHLLVAHVARRPAEAAVGIHVELLGPADGEDAADAAGHVLGALRVEALDVDHPGAQLPVLAV